MKTKSIGSVFLLFTIVTGIVAMSPVSFADYLHPIHPAFADHHEVTITPCLLYTSPSPRDQRGSRMPSSA